MPILALGVSHRHAPVELLELLSFAEPDLAKAYRRLLDLEAVRSGVILSTCNRVEVYAEVASYHAGFLDLKRFLSESREVDAEVFAEPLYAHYEDDAAAHLFAVAAGLDSMVLGEPQILSQVRSAYRRATAEAATGPLLSALFRGAIRTGRLVRAGTAIGASPAAFVEAGVATAADVLGDLRGRSAVVVGAGGMASLALAHLRERGLARLRVINRSADRARAVASRAGADAAGLDGLVDALAGADLVVSSTGAAGTVIRREAVEAARVGSPERPLFLLDLAVPRDVDPEVASVTGVVVANIDDLRSRFEGRLIAHAEEVDRARSLVQDEVRRFAAWRRAARLAPLIRALRERGAQIGDAELARVAPRLGRLTDREREAVDALARGIVAKLLHGPIVKLREPGHGDGLARAVAELFELEQRPEP